MTDQPRILRNCGWTTTTQVESSLKGDALAGFERQMQTARTRRDFWASFCAVPHFAIDSTETVAAWQQARNGLLAALSTKKADPFQSLTLEAATEAAVTRFGVAAQDVAAVSASLIRPNENVERVKGSIGHLVRAVGVCSTTCLRFAMNAGAQPWHDVGEVVRDRSVAFLRSGSELAAGEVHVAAGFWRRTGTSVSCRTFCGSYF